MFINSSFEVSHMIQLEPNVPDAMEVKFALLYTLYGIATLVALELLLSRLDFRFYTIFDMVRYQLQV